MADQDLSQIISLLLAGQGPEGAERISSTGFDAPTTGGDFGDLDFAGRLSSMLSGASVLDRLQTGSKLLGAFGPLGSAASFGIGQLARVAANKAFQTQPPIGFLEDISEPDLFGRSPLEIQRQRAKFSTVASTAAAKRAITKAEGLANKGLGGTGGGGLGRGVSPTGRDVAGTPF